MNNYPANLIDCPNCDGQFWPYDFACSFCGALTNEVDVLYCDNGCDNEIYGTFLDFIMHDAINHPKIKNDEIFKCNLCNIEFNVNYFLKEQMKTHERFHKHCKKEKRNTTEGNVIWLLVRNTK